jgi:hypothetical protein
VLSCDQGSGNGADPGPLLLSEQGCCGGQRGWDRGGSAGGLRIRVGTLNVGSMVKKSAEVADMLSRRKVDVCGLQEVRFKGEGVRFMQGGDNCRYKMFWKGGKEGLNGVGIAIKEEFARDVLKVSRVSERLMAVELVVEGVQIMFIVVYAPQVGRIQEEKEAYYDELYDFVGKVKVKFIVLGDFNGHVGSKNEGYEGIHGGNGFGDRNDEGEALLEFAMSFDLMVANTLFMKEPAKLVTYESGPVKTVVDYILVSKWDRSNVINVKAIPGEECVSQHKLLIMDMTIARRIKREVRRAGGKLRAWKLRDDPGKEEYRGQIEQVEIKGDSVQERWSNLEQEVRSTAETVCGRSKGGSRRKKETWWWNDGVSVSIKKKKVAYQDWRKDRSMEKLEAYRSAKKEARKVIAQAMEKKWGEMEEELEKGDSNLVFRIAKQRAKEKKDIIGAPCINDEKGCLKTEIGSRLHVWKDYCDKLMNMENKWDGQVESCIVEGPWRKVTEEEVSEALRLMKKGKAAGPTEISCEMLMNKAGIKGLCEVANGLLEGGEMPESWKRSSVIPLYKGKGDVLECGNYRTIKLLEHGMKVVERIFERRLRKMVEIREEQYGFMPGKGTTDAIFILRQLQEKYMEKGKELFFVFVDLEKAFDRVPRVLIESALRKKGVAECYVRAVMKMYEGVVSQVRLEGEDSDDFTVRVGIHQGSVLSPFLFAIVMDVVTEEVAKEGWYEMFADDLVLICRSRSEAERKFIAWKSALETKGLKVNINKTKVMRCAKDVAPKEAAVDPCSICGKRVGVNSIRCTYCTYWVHKKCSDVKGSLGRVKGFKCKTCASGGRKALDRICCEGIELECVGEFSYLGDTLNDAGGTVQAVLKRVRAAWMKFREISGVLCTRGISVRRKGVVYKACVRSVLTYGSETWAMTADVLRRLRSTERRMLRMICGVSLKDRIESEKVMHRTGVDDLEEHLRTKRLRWFGHVWRSEENAAIKRVLEFEVEGKRGRGRPKKRWLDGIEEDMKKRGVRREDALVRDTWRKKTTHGLANPCKQGQKPG